MCSLLPRSRTTSGISSSGSTSSEYGACGDSPVPGGDGSESSRASTSALPRSAHAALVQLITSQ
jgi:hypothetical protein